MVLPDLDDGLGHTVRLAIGAGKSANLFVVNRDSMGKYDPTKNNIYQELTGALPHGVWASPAYFDHTVYYGSVRGPIRAFKIANAKLTSSPTAQSANTFVYPPPTPSISADGEKNAIVWAVEGDATAVLHAYDAATLNELYNSNQASGGRDQFGGFNRFVTPTIANGKVFVGTPSGVAVFGSLPGHE